MQLQNTDAAEGELFPVMPAGMSPFDDDEGDETDEGDEADDDGPILSLADLDALLDDAAGLPLLERMRLTKELLSVRTALAAGPGLSERLKLTRRTLEIRKAMGAQPAPAKAAELGLLEDVAAGRMDSLPVADLLDKINAAIDALQVVGPLSADAEAAASAALVRWVDLEQKANG